MLFLLKAHYKSKCRAHVWDGEDTLCRMASTGGLKMGKYAITNETYGRRVCKNCINVGSQEGRLTKQQVYELKLDQVYELKLD